MKISIIIPVYHVEPYIVRCLQSVVAQKNSSDMEIILVDDCGTDNSIALATEFLAGCKGLDYQILYHSQNGGLSAARNTGLKAATGEYVYFLDSDDVITNDFMQLFSVLQEQLFYDFIIGDYRVEGSSSSYPPLLLQEGKYIGNSSILESFACGEWYMMAWNKLCRRSFLLENNLFFDEGILHEDVSWSFKLACCAQSMYVVRKDTYVYYIRKESIMTSLSLEKDIDNYNKVFSIISNYIVENGKCEDKNVYHWFAGRLSTFLFSMLQLERMDLYYKNYKYCHSLMSLSPLTLFIKGIVGIKYLVRDLNYCLGTDLGCIYKKIFYKFFYRRRGKRLEGSFWRV